MKCILLLFFSLIFYIIISIFSKYNSQKIILNCIFFKSECLLSNVIEILVFIGFLFGSTIFFTIYLHLYYKYKQFKKNTKLNKNKLLKSSFVKSKESNSNN